MLLLYIELEIDTSRVCSRDPELRKLVRSYCRREIQPLIDDFKEQGISIITQTKVAITLQTPGNDDLGK